MSTLRSGVNTTKGYVIRDHQYTSNTYYESHYIHKHNFFEMFIIADGGVRHHFNETSSQLETGDLVLIKPGDVHYFKNIKTPYHHIDLYAAPSVFKNVCDMISPTLYADFLNSNGLLVVNVDSLQKDDLVKQLANLYLIQDTGNIALINTHYYPLLFTFVSLVAQKYFINQSETDQAFNRFLAELNTVPYICGPLEAIVKLSNYSHGHLCKIFKERMGKTLLSYHHELKINYAIELMKNEKFSILDISSTLGFSSLSHFIKLFKAYTGFPPKQYRKNLLNK